MNTDLPRQILEIQPEAEAHFPHTEVTEAIVGAAFEVYDKLGYRFLERVYQRALQVELGFRAELEKRLTVHYEGTTVREHHANLTAEDRVVVETKTAPQYDKRDGAGVLNELKAIRFELGLLLIFGRSKVEFKRLLF